MTCFKMVLVPIHSLANWKEYALFWGNKFPSILSHGWQVLCQDGIVGQCKGNVQQHRNIYQEWLTVSEQNMEGCVLHPYHLFTCIRYKGVPAYWLHLHLTTRQHIIPGNIQPLLHHFSIFYQFVFNVHCP